MLTVVTYYSKLELIPKHVMWKGTFFMIIIIICIFNFPHYLLILSQLNLKCLWKCFDRILTKKKLTYLDGYVTFVNKRYKAVCVHSFLKDSVFCVRQQYRNTRALKNAMAAILDFRAKRTAHFWVKMRKVSFHVSSWDTRSKKSTHICQNLVRSLDSPLPRVFRQMCHILLVTADNEQRGRLCDVSFLFVVMQSSTQNLSRSWFRNATQPVLACKHKVTKDPVGFTWRPFSVLLGRQEPISGQ